MHIIEIILEGFKSYAQRTVISGFDQQFNAITGLNGSGKSNILDAIIFLLGLNKDWEILRVKKAQELVYKSGNAGIQQASVTIVFDNTDKQNSPIGYQDDNVLTITRQIVQDKSKFFVNGTKENMSKVKNLFRSVSLNVDNPHFLIAQNKIKQIISLKPTELISLLEETAGTALYNEKKKESRAIMEKKQDKVNEIDRILEEEVRPQIEKLRSEREQFLIWKSSQNEIERLNKLLRAHEYIEALNQQQQQSSQLQENMITQKEKQEQKQQLQKKRPEADGQLAILEQKRQKEHGVGQKTQEFNKSQGELHALETQINYFKKKITEGDKETANLEKTIKEHSDNAKSQARELEFCRNNLNQVEKEIQEKKNLIEETSSTVNQTQNNQKMVEDTKRQLKNQVAEAKKNINNSAIISNQYKNRISQLQDQIQQNHKNQENNQNNINQDQKQIAILTAEIEQLEKQIQVSEGNQSNQTKFMADKNTVDQEIMQLNHQVEEIHKMNRYQFVLNYRDPHPNFDRTKVKGRVYTLFTVQDQKYLKALEFGAGGKLYSIVVDSELTSKQLLKQNCFNFGVQMIPNNKIVYREVDPQVLKHAAEVCKRLNGQAFPAYSLIDYDQSIRPSMLFVFGNFVILNQQLL